MNQLDQPSMYRGNEATKTNWEVIGGDAPASLPAPAEETTSTTRSTAADSTEPESTISGSENADNPPPTEESTTAPADTPAPE